MPYKILVHTPDLSTPGGKQNYFAALQGKFRNEVDYFYYGSHGKKESKLKTLSRLVSQYWQFYRKIQNGNYDLIHLNPSLNPKSFYRDSLFAWLSTRFAKKTILFWHGWNWDFEKRHVQKILPFFRFSYGKADAMIVLSTDFENQLRQYNYKGPVYLESTVVDDEAVEKSNNGNSKKNNNEIRLLFLSRIEEAKGIFETLKGFEILSKKYPTLRLDVGGVGGALDAAQIFVKEKGIQNVNFLGWVKGKEKANLLQYCDIFVFPTFYGEGMPICILEAISVGKPVVTTPIGGVKDFFEDTKMGYLINVKDVGNLVNKIESLLKNPEIALKMGKYNYEYGLGHFRANIVCQRLEDIFEAVITGEATEFYWWMATPSHSNQSRTSFL